MQRRSALSVSARSLDTCTRLEGETLRIGRRFPRGERRQVERTGDPAFVDRVRELIPELGKDWKCLHTTDRAEAERLARAFLSTRAAMQRLGAEEDTDDARTRWTKMELALVLAEATGRRLGSIRQLKWEDIDWPASTIH